MATVKRFEDLEVWQKAREVCRLISALTLKDKFRKDFVLINQICRSSGSVMDNIAEGFERGSKKEFVQFLCIAKGSAEEVRSQLYRALDLNYISEAEFKEAFIKTEVLSKQISGFIKYLTQSDLKGLKNKLSEDKANRN